MTSSKNLTYLRDASNPAYVRVGELALILRALHTTSTRYIDEAQRGTPLFPELLLLASHMLETSATGPAIYEELPGFPMADLGPSITKMYLGAFKLIGDPTDLPSHLVSKLIASMSESLPALVSVLTSEDRAAIRDSVAALRQKVLSSDDDQALRRMIAELEN